MLFRPSLPPSITKSKQTEKGKFPREYIQSIKHKGMQAYIRACKHGWPCVLIVVCLFVILVISCFGFEDGDCFLIAPVPVHC